MSFSRYNDMYAGEQGIPTRSCELADKRTDIQPIIRLPPIRGSDFLQGRLRRDAYQHVTVLRQIRLGRRGTSFVVEVCPLRSTFGVILPMSSSFSTLQTLETPCKPHHTLPQIQGLCIDPNTRSTDSPIRNPFISTKST